MSCFSHSMIIYSLCTSLDLSCIHMFGWWWGGGGGGGGHLRPHSSFATIQTTSGTCTCITHACTVYNPLTHERTHMRAPQIRHSIDAGRKGMFLPHDYKFATTKTGSKHISSKLWAYPVTGVMEDLIPLTPSSHSETNLPAIAGVQEPPRPSKHGYVLMYCILLLTALM